MNYHRNTTQTVHTIHRETQKCVPAHTNAFSHRQPYTDTLTYIYTHKKASHRNIHTLSNAHTHTQTHRTCTLTQKHTPIHNKNKHTSTFYILTYTKQKNVYTTIKHKLSSLGNTNTIPLSLT